MRGYFIYDNTVAGAMYQDSTGVLLKIVYDPHDVRRGHTILLNHEDFDRVYTSQTYPYPTYIDGPEGEGSADRASLTIGYLVGWLMHEVANAAK